MNPQEALQKAVEIIGSQSRLAREIGVKQAHIHYWLTQAPVVPAEHCPTIEHVVKRRVRCEDLNPRVDWWVLRHDQSAAQGGAPGAAGTDTGTASLAPSGAALASTSSAAPRADAPSDGTPSGPGRPASPHVGEPAALWGVAHAAAQPVDVDLG